MYYMACHSHAATHEIAWNFEFLNPQAGCTPGLGIGTTPVQNVFLSLPDLTAFNNYLHDWKLNILFRRLSLWIFTS